jgi:hypothetical protein
LTQQLGEFLVAAELARRKLIATPFAGNVPAFDILVADEQCRTLPIQVKTTSVSTWPTRVNHWMDVKIDTKARKQIYRGPLKISEQNLIFVCVAVSKSNDSRDRFFIMRKKELQGICIEGYRRWMDSHGWKRPRNYRSMDLRFSIADIEQYEDNWDLVSTELNKRRGITA